MTVVGEWDGYVPADFTFADFAPGSRVLDVGFGLGINLSRLREAGCHVWGIEYDPGLAAGGRAAGLSVARAKAEHLPVRSASMDGVICKVVVPYTDEALAVAEIARVLRTGGIARIAYHGLGYSLKYVFGGADWRRRIYGVRTIVNTVVYVVTGRRMPGFLGDTLYQTRRRLQRYYDRFGLQIVEDWPTQPFMGAPVFIYQTLRRRPPRGLARG
jgi:SAM-dependent methyltransferase